MNNNLQLVSNLVAIANLAALQLEPDEPTRKQLAQCAIAVAHAGAWDCLENTIPGLAPEVQDQVLDAIEYIVEHPVLVDKSGQAYNARLFLIPVSQSIENNTSLQRLPNPELIQRLLSETLCPGGGGVLVNQLLPEGFLDDMSFSQIWAMAKAALSGAVTVTEDASDGLYLQHEAEVASGLHFVPFIALVPSEDCDELLALNGDDLAARSLMVLDSLNPLISEQIVRDDIQGLSVCLHLPQPFFYDASFVEIAHESYLFALQLNEWVHAADEEGAQLDLTVAAQADGDDLELVVTALHGNREVGTYCFWADTQDHETVQELCAAVSELAHPHGLHVKLLGTLSLPIEDCAPDMLALYLMPGPSTLQ